MEPRFAAGKIAPTVDHEIHVERIDVHAPEPPAGPLAGDQTGAGAQEGVEHQIAVAAVSLFDDSGDYLPHCSDAPAVGERASQLMPYLKNVIEVFDCPASKGLVTDANYLMTNRPGFYSEYELNGYLCSFGTAIGNQRRGSGIVDMSQCAYAYDSPYNPAVPVRAHAGGVNIGYLDGHAAFVPDADLGTIGTEDSTTFYVKGHKFSLASP